MADPNEIYSRNKAYSKPSKSYVTELSLPEQAKFYQWVLDNKAPYDPSPTADYDMPGYWKALQSGDERATSSINPNDKMIHYPDVWKTPYHQSFSAESQWATPNAPKWNELDQLVLPNGTVVYDERAQ